MSDFKHMNDGGGLLRTIEARASEMSKVEDGLEKGYAHLGFLLLEVAEMQYWRVHHETFKDYLRSVSMKCKKSPGQLQQYCFTVRDLHDSFTADQLESMGISKALKLRLVKDYALVFPQAIVNCALDPEKSVADLKKIISVTLKMSEEDGDYMDCGFEFMVTPEQRATIEQAIDVAMHTEPLTKTNISKSAQMLDVMMKFAMEFLGSHNGDGN
jgi:hypothetical protein